MTVTSRADVPTDAPGRYARQLLSHLGRRLETHEGDDGRHRVVFDGGECVLVEGEGVLTLQAQAADGPTLERVQDVVGSHLERFGQRAGLTVAWSD